MQSVDNREKITVLILLAASTMAGTLANDFSSSGEAAQFSPQSGRLLLAAAFGGSLIAVLMLLSPGKTHRSLRSILGSIWPQLAGLGALVTGYAFTLEPLGFFLATTLFFGAGSLLLGERCWWALLLLSVPAAMALQLILSGVFGLALHDPLMHAFGWVA